MNVTYKWPLIDWGVGKVFGECHWKGVLTVPTEKGEEHCTWKKKYI